MVNPKTYSSFVRSVLLLAVTSVAMAGTGCASEEVNPFDPRKLGQAQRDASRNQQTGELGELTSRYNRWVPRSRRAPTTAEATTIPSTTGPVVTGTEPIVPMTLQEVIERTVVNNLAIRVAGFGPSIEAARVIEAEARFDPTFFSNFTVDRSDRTTAGTPFNTPNLFDDNIIDEQQQVQYTAQSGLRQVLAGGGQIELSQRLRRTDLNPATEGSIDPFTESDLILQLTQPLLRDFGGLVNQARIDIARQNQRISVLEFQRIVEEQVLQVEQLYWQLIAAQRDVRTQEVLLERTERTANILAERLGNDVSIQQLSQTQGSIGQRRSQLIQARSRVRDLSDQIKQIMNEPTLVLTGPEVLSADSTPLQQPIRFDLNEQIDTALQYRAELAQQQLRTDIQTTTLGAARNNLLPQLNFVGSINPMGGGDSSKMALNRNKDFNHISYSLGLQFEVPLGNREARAIYARTLDSRTQAILTLNDQQQQVTLDVRINYRAVETAWNALTNLREARLAFERTLESIQDQEDAAEPLTPDFIDRKLRAQQELAIAESAESEALANYNVALSRLERAKGTLLRYNNIMLQERGSKVKSRS